MYIYNMEHIYNLNKILYLGTGLHIEPVLHFPFAKEFIFVDILPRNNFNSNKYDEELYDESFINNLIEKCNTNNFKLEKITEKDTKYSDNNLSFYQKIKYLFNKPKHINPSLLLFKNLINGQLIKYYISTNIEETIDNELIYDIGDADGFILSGYSPSTKVLDYFIQPKIFLGYSNIDYSIEVSDVFDSKKRDNIIYLLYTNKKEITSNYFDKYYLVIYRNGVKIECKNYEDFLENYFLVRHI